MAEKRGRKPEGDYHNKTHVLTTRITAELRESLEVSRTKHIRTRSLSQEVEDRLRKSFDEDQLAMKFGGKEVYAIARLTAEVLDAVPKILGRHHWADSALTVNACTQAIGAVLREFQLEDDATIPAHLTKHFQTPEDVGAAVAGGILDQLKMTGGVPIDQRSSYYSKQSKLYPKIKDGLGVLIERMK